MIAAIFPPLFGQEVTTVTYVTSLFAADCNAQTSQSQASKVHTLVRVFINNHLQ